MDDPIRASIRRAVFGALLSIAVFVVLTLTKEMKPAYVHAPWLNDPYDTAISFAMFFVPLMAVIILVQTSLCLRSEPLSVPRVVSIIRACRLAVGVVAATSVSAWLAVILQANKSQWTWSSTGFEVGLLVVVTAMVSVAAMYLAHVRRIPNRIHRSSDEHDWIGDAMVVAMRESRRFGVFRNDTKSIVELCERVLVDRVRRHPTTAAALTSAGFGAAVFGWQACREGYVASVTLLSMGLGFCGMYSFLMFAGSYFGLVRSTNPSSGLRRRAIDGSVVGGAAAIVVLAFRGNLWGTIGSNGTAAGPAQLAALEAGAILLAFVCTLLAESLLRSHARFAR